LSDRAEKIPAKVTVNNVNCAWLANLNENNKKYTSIFTLLRKKIEPRNTWIRTKKY
jgi:hypothetical protein